MTTLEKINDDLYEMGVELIDCRMKVNIAVAFEQGYIGIDTHKIDNPCVCASVLAGEAGHFYSGQFYHADNPYEVREQSEFRASRAMWFRLMPPESFRAALDSGCHEVWELAEWFGLLEDDIAQAWQYYKDNGYL